MCTICKQNVRLFYFSAFCVIFIIGNFARKKDMLKPGCNGRFLLMFSRKIKAAALFFACVFLCSCGITRWDGFEKEDLSKYLILGEYRGLELTEYDVSVSDSEVDEAINTALAALAGETETDSGIADGDTVVFDRFCFIGGESLPELSEEKGRYTAGGDASDAAVTALLPLMKGMKAGDTAELEITLPAGYVDGSAPATAAVYRVTVISVLRKELPVLDNETAEKLMPGCGGADAYRSAVRKQLEEKKKTEADYKRGSEAWNRIVSSSVLTDAPYDVFSGYYEEIIDSCEKLAGAQSQKLEEYVESSLGMDMEKFEEQARDRALDETKEAFVLWSIVKKENLTATDEEINVYADGCAASSAGVFGSGEDFIAYYGKEKVREMLYRDRIIAIAVGG